MLNISKYFNKKIPFKHYQLINHQLYTNQTLLALIQHRKDEQSHLFKLSHYQSDNFNQMINYKFFQHSRKVKNQYKTKQNAQLTNTYIEDYNNKNQQTYSKQQQQFINLKVQTFHMLFFSQQVLSQLINVNKLRDNLSLISSNIQKPNQQNNQFFSLNQNQTNYFATLNKKVFNIIHSNPYINKGNFEDYQNYPLMKILQICLRFIEQHHSAPKNSQASSNQQMIEKQIYQNQSKLNHWKKLQQTIKSRLRHCALKDYLKILYIALQTFPSIYRFNYSFINSLIVGFKKEIPLMEEIQTMQLFIILSQSLRQGHTKWQNYHKFSQTIVKALKKNIKSPYFQRQLLTQLQEQIIQKMVKRYQQKFINTQLSFKQQQLFKLCYWIKLIVAYKNTVLNKINQVENLQTSKHVIGLVDVVIERYNLLRKPVMQKSRYPQLANKSLAFKSFDQLVQVFQSLNIAKEYLKGQQEAVVGDDQGSQKKRLNYLLKCQQINRSIRTLLTYQNVYNQIVSKFSLGQDKNGNQRNDCDQIESQKEEEINANQAQYINSTQLKNKQNESGQVQKSKKRMRLRNEQNKWKILSIISSCTRENKSLQSQKEHESTQWLATKAQPIKAITLGKSQQTGQFSQSEQQINWHKQLLGQFNLIENIKLSNQVILNQILNQKISRSSSDPKQGNLDQSKSSEKQLENVKRLLCLAQYQLNVWYQLFQNGIKWKQNTIDGKQSRIQSRQHSINQRQCNIKNNIAGSHRNWKQQPLIQSENSKTVQLFFSSNQDELQIEDLIQTYKSIISTLLFQISNQNNVYQNQSSKNIDEPLAPKAEQKHSITNINISQILQPQTIKRIINFELFVFRLSANSQQSQSHNQSQNINPQTKQQQFKFQPFQSKNNTKIINNFPCSHLVIQYISQTLNLRQQKPTPVVYIRQLQFLFYNYLLTYRAYMMKTSNDSKRNPFDHKNSRNQYTTLTNLSSIMKNQPATVKIVNQLIQILQNRNLQALKYLQQKNLQYDTLKNTQNNNFVLNNNNNKYLSLTSNNFKNINQIALAQKSKLIQSNNQQSKHNILMGDFIMKCINKQRKNYLKNDSIVKLTKFFTQVKAFKEIKFCYPITIFSICPQFVFYPSNTSKLFNPIVLYFLPLNQMHKPQTLVLRQIYKNQNIKMELIDIDQFLSMHINQRLQKLKFSILQAQDKQNNNRLLGFNSSNSASSIKAKLIVKQI